MPRKFRLSDQWSFSIFFALLLCFCLASTDSSSKPKSLSPSSTSEKSGEGSSSSKLDATELKKSNHTRIAPRKGVLNPPDMDDMDQSSESCSVLPGHNQTLSGKCSTSSPVTKNDSSTSGDNSPTQKNESKVKTLTNSSANSSVKPEQVVTMRVKLIPTRLNLTNNSSTVKPVMKPSYTSDDFSNADYDQTENSYSSKSSWFLTTFSLSVFIVFLVVLIFALFYKLKYKFSVQQNYRRVDYLIDGMYIE